MLKTKWNWYGAQISGCGQALTGVSATTGEHESKAARWRPLKAYGIRLPSNRRRSRAWADYDRLQP